MNFVNTISHDEQRLFTLLFIYHYREMEESDAYKEVLMRHIPDMTKDPTETITEKYMDQILEELMDSGYIQVELGKAGSCYRLSQPGIDSLRRDSLLISPGRESVLSRYLPEQDLRHILNALADALNAQVGIMNENSEFLEASSQPVRGICDQCIRDVSYASCTCSELLTVLRARRIGVHSYKCHAGFVECVAPIELSGDQCGYLFLGRIIPDNMAVDRFIEYCKDRGDLALSEEEIRVLIAGQKRASRDQIEFTENITAGIAVVLSAMVATRQNNMLLLRIADIQSRASSIEDLLDKVAMEMALAFKCQVCEIALVERDLDVLTVRGVYGSERKDKRYKISDDTFIGRVANRRETIRLPTIEDFYRPQPLPIGSLEPGSRLGVPMEFGRTLIGVFELANRRKTEDNPSGEFTRDGEYTARIIAAAIAKTVYEYQEWDNVAALLSETDRLYTKDGDATSALKYMVENLGKSIAGSWGSLYRHDTKENTFIRVAFSNVGGEPPGKMKQGHIANVARSIESQYISDALNSEEHRALLDSSPSDDVAQYIQNIGSEYAVPLIVVDRLYGVFCFYKAGVDSFSIADKQAADDLAARASLLLESHEMLDARRRLYDASMRLQSELRPDELLRAIVERIVEIGYDRARLYLVLPDEERIESVVQQGFIEQENIRRFENREIVSRISKGLRIPQTDSPQEIGDVGIVTHVLELGLPAIYVRKDSDSHRTIGERNTEGIQVYIASRDLDKGNLEREGVDEWLDFPLIAAGKKLGKITVDNKWSKKPLSGIDCEVLGLFGQYAAQAILNALEIERTAGFGYGARTLAHNIKNRAAAISMILDLVERPLPPDDKLTKRMGTLRRANDAILRHVNAMRKVSDLEETELRLFTIEELAEPVWNELKDAFDMDKVSFEVSIPKEVLNERVEVDSDQIIEVFLNFMRNSLEAGADKVFLSVWLESDYVYVSWQDDGSGISEKDSESLFKMGFTTKLGGTGTGLYSVKRMLLKNKGDVWLDRSKKNEAGNYVAYFVIKIPLLRGKPKRYDTGRPEKEGHGDDNPE